MAPTIEHPDSHGADGQAVAGIVEHIRAMALADQLEVLQRLAVATLPELADDDRTEFIQQLNVAVSRALSPSRPAAG